MAQALLLLLVVCCTLGFGTRTSSAQVPGTILAGRFVAWIDGARLTSFGLNHDSYIFQVESAQGPQFVTLSYAFAQFEPELPKSLLDYSQLHKVRAVPDQRCGETLETMSRSFLFTPKGEFLEVKYALTYVKNVPPITLPWKASLPCFVLPLSEVAQLRKAME